MCLLLPTSGEDCMEEEEDLRESEEEEAAMENLRGPGVSRRRTCCAATLPKAQSVAANGISSENMYSAGSCGRSPDGVRWRSCAVRLSAAKRCGTKALLL
ncbi:unnamed protein product [Pleuronectes platessa]|uniref:Uncharacterized protein n=1 Tax=Pleuronectes platessa TaxID=8262 RepID=A0A9N7VN94_PLEPL|nr:unnamed protein product [Pleuronectes platessa]